MCDVIIALQVAVARAQRHATGRLDGYRPGGLYLITSLRIFGSRGCSCHALTHLEIQQGVPEVQLELAVGALALVADLSDWREGRQGRGGGGRGGSQASCSSPCHRRAS
jgi:hypothetical protein